MLRRTDLRRSDLSARQLAAVLPRAEVDVASALQAVAPVLADVRRRGAAALRDAAERFDGVRPEHLRVPASALARALPDEDEETLEASASLCAADASLMLLSGPGAGVLADRRVVIAADVDAAAVSEVPVSEEILPGTVQVGVPVAWEAVAALLVDEREVEVDVRAARTGDEAAFERVGEADLLWFDVSEREYLAAELG